MLANVFAATMFVGIEIETDELPARIVASAGGMADSESLKKSTTTPPAGAWPLSMATAPALAPPLMVPGVTVRDLSEGARTLNCMLACPEFSVAVRVTGVGELT